MSQQDIADALGVTASWVGHIETGQNQFASRERLWALAQVLQTDTLDLLIAAGYWKEPNVYSGIDPQLLNIARDSSPESQKMVVDLLRQINQAG
jgi:transcriptional regulator with XRE-family HTH domain